MNKQLGKTVGIVERMFDEWDEETLSLQAFGAPAECYHAVARSKVKQLNELIQSLGYESASSLAIELEARTSAHYVHFRTRITSLVNW